MIVAIQQPEHLPWIGFFNKMMQCDLYVYLDNVQFKKRYFENRNKIKAKDGIRWLTVPVVSKGHFDQKINEVLIDNSTPWQKKYLGSLDHAYRKTPYWEAVQAVVQAVAAGGKEMLLDLNLALIKECREYLGIETKTVLSSTLDVGSVNGSDLILEICRRVHATVYISGPDGRNYLDADEFARCGIRIVYHDFRHPVYTQMNGNFESHMSIIDLLANCGPASSGIIGESYKVEHV